MYLVSETNMTSKVDDLCKNVPLFSQKQNLDNPPECLNNNSSEMDLRISPVTAGKRLVSDNLEDEINSKKRRATKSR